jgi:hypothetical protein
MKRYLLPLKVFAGGMLLCLIGFLFLSHTGTAVDQLGTDTAAYAGTFWNWGWISQGGYSHPGRGSRPPASDSR